MRRLRARIFRFFILIMTFGVLTVGAITLTVSRMMARDAEFRDLFSVHQIVANGVRQAFAISDYSEVQRILALSKTSSREFGLLSKTGEWILPDYSLQPGFEAVATEMSKDRRCAQIPFYSKNNFCSPLGGSAVLYSLGRKTGTSAETYYLLLALTIGPLLVMMMLLNWFLLNKVTRPVEAFQNELRDLALDTTDFKKMREQDKIMELSEIRQAVNRLICRIESDFKVLQRIEQDKVAYDLARQISHDIRSPLAALDTLSYQLEESKEETRILLRVAIQRIRDIANNVLNVGHFLKEKDNGADFCFIPAVINQLISEKRLMLGNDNDKKFEVHFPKNLDLFVNVPRSILSRVLSNILNNSLESFEKAGLIRIDIERHSKVVSIKVSDNGCGIPKAVLHFIGQDGFSFGKNSGHGLGISHAREVLKKAGGTMSITSEEGVGTQVTLEIPIAKAPSWFISELETTENQTVVIVDDDDSIHEIWKSKIREKNLMHFSSATSFVEYIAKKSDQLHNPLFLIDYEFRSESLDGLTIIKNLGLEEKSILVTSRYEESKVLEKINTLQMRMIPKGMVPHLQVC